ncbi:MAG: hypothetical protein LBG87_05180, partial [Spirochaetaceae bacterium]|nr:hypothetical protein [Spirochaetaceae bacterium]
MAKTARKIFGGLMLGAMLALAACPPMSDGFSADDWDAGGGKVYIRIGINSARLALPADSPKKEDLTYFEAIFKEQSAENYYIGTATAG